MSPTRKVLYKSKRRKNPLEYEIINKKNKTPEREIAQKILEATKKRIEEMNLRFKNKEKGLKLVKEKFIFDLNKKKFITNEMYGSYKLDAPRKGYIRIDVVLDEKGRRGRKIELENYLGGEKEFEIIIDELRENYGDKIEFYELNTPNYIFRGRLHFKEMQDFINEKRYAD